ncbi:lipid II flippase MurJ, partial [Bordetella petrii]|nr:lipid II flippase MurJ [Bordetella petrii]
TVVCRRGVYRPAAGWPRFLLRMLPALAALAMVLLYADRHLNWIALQSTPGLRALWLGGVLAASMAAYFACLFACGFRLRDFGRRHAS